MKRAKRLNIAVLQIATRMRWEVLRDVGRDGWLKCGLGGTASDEDMMSTSKPDQQAAFVSRLELARSFSVAMAQQSRGRHAFMRQAQSSDEGDDAGYEGQRRGVGTAVR